MSYELHLGDGIEFAEQLPDDAVAAIPATPALLLAPDELIAWAQFGTEEGYIVGPARDKMARHVAVVQAALAKLSDMDKT